MKHMEINAATAVLVALALGAGGCGAECNCLDIDGLDIYIGSDEAMPDAAGDATDDTGTDAAWDSTEPPPFEWPVPTEDVVLEPSADWKNTVVFPDDPFLGGTGYTGYITKVPRWIKFAVLMKDPDKVYFQDSQKYVFHYEFAHNWIEQFTGMSTDEFDLATLFEKDQQLILGAVLYAPGGTPAEVGIQLVRQDAYHPEMVKRVWDTVTRAVTHGPVTKTTADALKFFYFPTFEQYPSAMHYRDWYARNGIEISSVDRWADGNQCYSAGWAVGRLVEIPGAQIDAAYLAGDLLPTDILLTDAVPAEVPFVAGIISTTASTPNSHVAILATSLEIPFVWLAADADVDAARALAGKRVALWTGGTNMENTVCVVNLADATAMTDGDLATLTGLKNPVALEYRPKQFTAAYTKNTDDIGPGDIVYFGGKAANYGVLRDAIPGSAQTAIAVSFLAWDDFMAQPYGEGTLAQAIAAKLAPHASWPPDMATLDADLAAVREMIRTAPFPASGTNIIAPLTSDLFPDPTRKIRFRSSTNVEDAADFTGAGLYDSYSGCVADELDADETGPSACDPSEPAERGVFRAIRKVYASFYNRNAYLERLRRGVNESEVAMGLLVHYSYPDEDELANGVATFRKGDYSSDARMVTQAGALSVANPEGGATPEVVTGYLWQESSDVSLTTLTESSLVPIGGHVMTYPDDYSDLFGLLKQVETRWAALTGHAGATIDVEYKKMRVDGGGGSALQVKQVREVPAAATGTVDTYLVGGTAEWCTFQGENSDVYGVHRVKVRLSATVKNGFVKDFEDNAWLTGLHLQFVRGGIVRSLDLPGEGVNDIAWSRDGDSVALTFKSDVDGETLTWALTANLPLTRDRLYGPFYQADDAVQYWSGMQMSSNLPMYWLDWEGSVATRTDESAGLVACDADLPIGPDHIFVQRDYTDPKGHTYDLDFWWPPYPTGIIAGYTAPLIQWGATVITGFTTTPITLANDWSRSQRPGHHNFSEDYAFEPRLDPGVDAATLAELEAADIAVIYLLNANTYSPTEGGTVCIEHMDRTMTCDDGN